MYGGIVVISRVVKTVPKVATYYDVDDESSLGTLGQLLDTQRVLHFEIAGLVLPDAIIEFFFNKPSPSNESKTKSSQEKQPPRRLLLLGVNSRVICEESLSNVSRTWVCRFAAELAKLSGHAWTRSVAARTPQK